MQPGAALNLRLWLCLGLFQGERPGHSPVPAPRLTTPGPRCAPGASGKTAPTGRAEGRESLGTWVCGHPLEPGKSVSRDRDLGEQERTGGDCSRVMNRVAGL